jgi:hypothetical protein
MRLQASTLSPPVSGQPPGGPARRSRKEILRRLRRYIAREIYPSLLSPASLGGR